MIIQFITLYNIIKHVPDDLDGDTRLVLINAVYFKGNWKQKFDPELTEPMPFHVDENTTKQVPTMYRKGHYNFGHIPEFEATYVELPYEVSIFYSESLMFIFLILVDF